MSYNKRVRAVFFFLAIFIFSTSLDANSGNKKSATFDFDWKFNLGDITEATQPDYDDSNWRILDLPHDWSIEGEFIKGAPAGGNGAFLPTGIGRYRKHFNVSKSDLNKIIWIEFDGVYMNSDVWINGKFLGNNPYGYTSFYYDLTPHLHLGENVISVRVDNSQQPNSRWYSGSGIYRHVWLTKQDPLHIAHWGVYATTPEVTNERALVNVETKIDNEYKTKRNGKLRSVIIDKNGNEVSNNEIPFFIEAGKTFELKQQIIIENPSLWSTEIPTLYKLKQTIILDTKIVDTQITNIGIRKIEFDANTGFFLNDKHVKMNGVCLHHDGGCVGAAVPLDIWKARFKILKEMGCNAIRSSHNPPAPEFLDLCDQMGFLVMNEAFDEWKTGKRDYSYHINFEEHSESDLISMLHRDRNHPSIVIWSVGNEVPDQKTEEGTKILKYLSDICHKEDPTRPVTQACDNIAADGGSTALSFLNALDIVGYNYVDRWHERRELFFDIDKREHPEWKMIGTENRSNKGVLRGDYSLGDDPTIVRPNYNYNMIDQEQLWKFVKMHDYVIGDFMWTGYDYLGESRWPLKNRNFGVLDLAGFPKDGYYFYKSQWTEEPMVHLFPHWNWEGREGQIIPVVSYSNCSEVELFLNGKSYGEKRLEFPRQGCSGRWNSYEFPLVKPTTADLHLQWDIPYEPGTLKAVGKINGKIVFTEVITTTGKPNSIRLSYDDETISVEQRGVANIKVEIVDVNGNLVPTADNPVHFSIEGEAKLIGVSNGNPADLSSFKANNRKAYNGLCLAVIQTTRKEGDIKVIASSDGLTGSSLLIKAVK